MPLLTSSSSPAKRNINTSSSMARDSQKSPASRYHYPKSASDQLTTKMKSTEVNSTGGKFKFEKINKRSKSLNSRINVSGKLESQTKPANQNDRLKGPCKDVIEPLCLEKSNSSSSVQYDCEDHSESDEENRFECFTARELEEHIKSLTRKISKSRLLHHEDDITKKTGSSFDKRGLSKRECECNSNNLVESRKNLVKGRACRLSDESRSRTMSQKFSKSSIKTRSSSPHREEQQYQLHNTAKQIVSATQQRPNIDNDAVVDLISLLNPEVGDIVIQMQSQAKQKQKQEVKKESEIKNKTTNQMMNCNLDELRMILLASKDKYDNLKAKAVRMRTQYILKSNRLKQMQRNMRILIDRYKEFKKLHDDCDNQRQTLRNKLFQAVKSNDESEQLVQEFSEARMIYAERIKSLQEENQKLKREIEDICDAHRRNETIDRELHDSLDTKIELLESVRIEMKKKDETIQRLQAEVDISSNETKAILEQSKRYHEEIGSIRTLLKQKELEANEAKLKVKMQEKTIKHLQLAYNLLLSDQDITSKSSADKRFKLGGDSQTRHHSIKDISRSNAHLSASNDVDEDIIHHKLLSEASDLINSRKNVYAILSKHCNLEENRAEDHFLQLLGGRAMPQQCNGRPDVKEESASGSKNFSKSNSCGETPEELPQSPRGTLNNSHSDKHPDKSVHSSAKNIDGNPGNGDRTNKQDEDTNYSASSYLKALFNVHDIRSQFVDVRTGKHEDSVTAKHSTVIVEVTDGSQSSTQRSTKSDISKSSTPKSREKKTRDAKKQANESDSQPGTPRIPYTDRTSGSLKKGNRRSNSVPKHVTFVGTPEKVKDRDDSAVRSWCGSPITPEVQSEGAHPLLCKRQIGKTRNNGNSQPLSPNQMKYHELSTLQRKLDNLKDLVENQELGFYELKDQVASVVSHPNKNLSSPNDSTIQILSLLFDSGKPVPTLNEI